MFVFVYAGTWKEQLDNLFATKLKTINSNQVLQSHLFLMSGIKLPWPEENCFSGPTNRPGTEKEQCDFIVRKR